MSERPMVAGMSNVTQATTWTIHVADEDDEWAALCGTPEPEMVVEETSSHLPGYSLCNECVEVVDKRS